MKKSRAQRVKEAIKSIKEFHRIGRRLPPNQGHQQAYGLNQLENKARSTGINEDTLRKARQFADPINGFSQEEVEDLCALIRKHQLRKEAMKPVEKEGKKHARKEAIKPVFGKTHIIILMRVRNKESRKELVEKAVKEAWSKKELESNIALSAEKNNPNRAKKDRGRRPRIPKDLDELLIQIRGKCQEWLRWEAELSSEQEQGKEKHIGLGGLPLPLRKKIDVAMESLRLLEKEALRQLRRLSPADSLKGDLH